MPHYLPFVPGFKDKSKFQKPRVCCPEGQPKLCGEEMICIPYRRRDEDAQTLNCFVCPKCDAYDAWPRST